MLERLSNLSSIACGSVAAALIVAASGIYFGQTAEASATQPPASDNAVDLATFAPSQSDGHVHLMAQINRAYQFPITDGNEGQAYLIPLFTAADTYDSTRVAAAVVVRDLVAFDEALSQNVIGNARIGDLYAIEGVVTDAGAFEPGVTAALEMASLEVTGNFTLIDASAPVAASAWAMPTDKIAMGMLAGALLLGAGALVAFTRDRRATEELSGRFNALQGAVIPAE